MTRRLPAVALVLASAVLLSACGGLSDDEAAACHSFADANNAVVSASNAWKADGSPEGGTPELTAAYDALPGAIRAAAAPIRGDLATLLDSAAVFADTQQESEDARLGYQLVQVNVYDLCEKMAVPLDIVTWQ